MNIPSETIERIKTAADIVEVVGRSVVLKVVGKEHKGLCPFHNEKTPSFSVVPGKHMFYCFGCGAHGDVIEFLVKKDGVRFIDAAMLLAGQYGIEIEGSRGQGFEGSSAGKTRNYKPETKNQEYVPEKAIPPADVWREKAEKLVSWAHDNLCNYAIYDWRVAELEKRGIDIDLIKEFRIGWNPMDIYRPREAWGLPTELKDDGKTRKKLWIPEGFVIPLMNGKVVERVRIRTEREQPKYYVMPGSGMRCLVPGGAVRAYVIIESELDAIMVWGKIRANKIGVVALGSAQRHPELETYDLLKKVPVILNALDFDQAGRKALEWWEERFPEEIHRRWPVPHGKDPGDAFKAGLDIAGWIRAGLPEAWKWEVESRLKTEGCRLKVEKNQKPETTNQKPESRFAGTIGRSDLLDDDVKEAGSEVSSLEEFVAIVKKWPQVTIHVSPERLKIDEQPAWARAFPELSRRLSELVFMNKEVTAYLMGLGSAKVDSRNIESRISDIEHRISDGEKNETRDNA
jgi:DNA primase